MALVMEPGIAAKIDEIVVMGGARSGGGNITASAEYNIYADPHAAQIVIKEFEMQNTGRRLGTTDPDAVSTTPLPQV